MGYYANGFQQGVSNRMFLIVTMDGNTILSAPAMF